MSGTSSIVTTPRSSTRIVGSPDHGTTPDKIVEPLTPLLRSIIREQHGTITDIEEAVKPLRNKFYNAKSLDLFVKMGKEQTRERLRAEPAFLPPAMTVSEAVTVFLYTGQHLRTEDGLYRFHHHLNECLHTRKNLEPYGPFLCLFLSALRRLPVHRGTVWRGVAKQVATEDKYNVKVQKLVTWLTFSSTTRSLSVVKEFLADQGDDTIFNIGDAVGYDISRFSIYPDEEEVLIAPLSRFKVKGRLQLSRPCNNITDMIHLEQVTPLDDVFAVFETLTSTNTPPITQDSQLDGIALCPTPIADAPEPTTSTASDGHRRLTTYEYPDDVFFAVWEPSTTGQGAIAQVNLSTPKDGHQWVVTDEDPHDVFVTVREPSVKGKLAQATPSASRSTTPKGQATQNNEVVPSGELPYVETRSRSNSRQPGARNFQLESIKDATKLGDEANARYCANQFAIKAGHHDTPDTYAVFLNVWASTMNHIHGVGKWQRENPHAAAAIVFTFTRHKKTSGLLNDNNDYGLTVGKDQLLVDVARHMYHFVFHLNVYEGTVFRGEQIGTEMFQHKKFTSARFLSTSKNCAEGGESNPFRRLLIFVGGHGGRSIEEYSSFPEKEEVIILPNTPFVVTHHYKKGDEDKFKVLTAFGVNWQHKKGAWEFVEVCVLEPYPGTPGRLTTVGARKLEHKFMFRKILGLRALLGGRAP